MPEGPPKNPQVNGEKNRKDSIISLILRHSLSSPIIGLVFFAILEKPKNQLIRPSMYSRLKISSSEATTGFPLLSLCA